MQIQKPLCAAFYAVMEKKNLYLTILVFFLAFMFLSCSSRLGYGVLLWSIDDPSIESGTILPVYVRSNIEKIWVVGLPENENTDKNYKFEIPLSFLEFVGNKKQTLLRYEEFVPYAALYAENMQDRLPIRDNPDNNSRQVYRLRLGEIIKILGIAVNGIPPISTTGSPLEGDWYRVMTNDGIIGYCFSYRLKIFNEKDAPIIPVIETAVEPSSVAESAPSQQTLSVTPAQPSIQEIRANQYSAILNQGPVFTSNNYGTITFSRASSFAWEGFGLLVPHVIHSEADGTGLVKMNLGVSSSLDERYDGAFTFEFYTTRSYDIVNFMYGLDNQGLRLEVVPDHCIENGIITSRDSAPLVLYFFKDSF